MSLKLWSFSPQLPLRSVRKGCKHYFIGKISRDYRRKTIEGRRQSGKSRATSTVCRPPPSPPFSTWLLCLLSQVTLRLEADSISTFQCLLTFGVRQLRSDANPVPHLFVSPGSIEWNNLHQSLPPLGLFFTPKTTNCQPTTASSAMVWLLSFPLHEQCVKTAPSWWRF